MWTYSRVGKRKSGAAQGIRKAGGRERRRRIRHLWQRACGWKTRRHISSVELVGWKEWKRISVRKRQKWGRATRHSLSVRKVGWRRDVAKTRHPMVRRCRDQRKYTLDRVRSECVIPSIPQTNQGRDAGIEYRIHLAPPEQRLLVIFATRDRH